MYLYTYQLSANIHTCTYLLHSRFCLDDDIPAIPFREIPMFLYFASCPESHYYLYFRCHSAFIPSPPQQNQTNENTFRCYRMCVYCTPPANAVRWLHATHNCLNCTHKNRLLFTQCKLFAEQKTFVSHLIYTHKFVFFFIFYLRDL